MKKTLLASTAIAGSMMLLGATSALSQTTVSGNLNLSYKAIGNKGATANKVNSTEYFGKEVQINIANKGTLNNGLGYAAGFSIEQDGSQMSSTASTTSGTTDAIGVFSENVYIDLIAGKTTISFGADHVQNPDNEITNLVGVVDIDDNASGIMALAPNYVNNAGSAYQAFGVAVIQSTDVGNFSLRYTPDSTNGLASGDDGATGTATGSFSVGEAAYEVGYVGSPVKGLSLQGFYSQKGTGIAGKNELDSITLGAKYNFGAFTAAMSQKEQDTLGTANADITTKTRAFGIAYAATPNVTVGVNMASTEQTSTTVKEKMKQVSVGYNLGPIFAGVSYVKAENVDNLADKEGNAGFVFMGTKF
jgi:hypothetical protein